jgi:hypothetical protein
MPVKPKANFVHAKDFAADSEPVVHFPLIRRAFRAQAVMRHSDTKDGIGIVVR